MASKFALQDCWFCSIKKSQGSAVEERARGGREGGRAEKLKVVCSSEKRTFPYFSELKFTLRLREVTRLRGSLIRERVGAAVSQRAASRAGRQGDVPEGLSPV